ncbi:centromere protein s [Anaeramoeba flamelloides]|uniref:Centromere protein s n=1 Tax=Anaeramoeba flamelloides TaxID=1746091 RepID=A0ABQ8XRP1_9EUKA|nr:centromere protein s [Anaeramoeba flamelloides]
MSYLKELSKKKETDPKLRQDFDKTIGEILKENVRQVDLHATESALKTFSNIIYEYTTKLLASDLEEFALHAKRTTIKPADVFLCSRKNLFYEQQLKSFMKQNLSNHGAKRKKTTKDKKTTPFQDLEGIEILEDNEDLNTLEHMSGNIGKRKRLNNSKPPEKNKNRKKMSKKKKKKSSKKKKKKKRKDKDKTSKKPKTKHKRSPTKKKKTKSKKKKSSNKQKENSLHLEDTINIPDEPFDLILNEFDFNN